MTLPVVAVAVALVLCAACPAGWAPPRTGMPIANANIASTAKARLKNFVPFDVLFGMELPSVG
jgi:hypothetical protein